MEKIRVFLKQNKLYVVLTFFLIGINAAVLADKIISKNEQNAEVRMQEGKPPAPEVKEDSEKYKKGTLFREEDIKKREQKLAELSQDEPLVYVFFGVINLLIVFLILTGILIDIYLLVRFFKKEPINIKLNNHALPKWTIGDVVRVTIIFLSFGYLIALFQLLLMDHIPLLNNDNFMMVFNTAMINIIGISVILYFIVVKHGQKFEDLGLSLSKAGKSLFLGGVGYLALLPVLIVVMVITFVIVKALHYEPPVQSIVRVIMEEKAAPVLWLSTLFAAIFGPIAEEIFFRGFMYSAVKKKLGIIWGMLISALVFSALHAHIVGFFPIFALGILLAYLYEKTGSLLSSMTVHIIHNLGMLVLVFMMRYLGV